MFMIPTIILATCGLGVSISSGFIEDDQYKVLTTEALLLDERYLKELSIRYENLKKKYFPINLVGFGLFIAGMLSFGIEKKFSTTDFMEPYYPVCIAVIAIGTYIITRTLTVLEAYKLLAKNETYVGRFSFRLRKKVKKKFDDL